MFYNAQAAHQSIDTTPDTDLRMPALHLAVCAVNVIIVVPIVLSMTCLLAYQLGLLSKNVTTIEDFERDVLKKRVKQQGKVKHCFQVPISFTSVLLRFFDIPTSFFSDQHFVWHYDLGCWRENYKQVLGPEIKHWFTPWPTSPKECDVPLLDSKDTGTDESFSAFALTDPTFPNPV